MLCYFMYVYVYVSIAKSRCVHNHIQCESEAFSVYFYLFICKYLCLTGGGLIFKYVREYKKQFGDGNRKLNTCT